ncbi:hypothetical protein ORJ66_07365 [Pseudoalteromonas tunicata]|uniref:hypothetical protein n=1 Tax=Pseudoalteromonas tunicata TaxID=314281 RepID=UPI00273ECFF1|nr:hypothetical protein [Pseudoalteromonas tunicata]MDP5212860.1 hypothetical protein [Pseudoalteromonas tunicata]
MFKLFIKGLVFGSGFIVSLLIFEKLVALNSIEHDAIEDNLNKLMQTPNIYSFDKADLNEKITLASHVFVTKYEESENGFGNAIITKVLKNSETHPLPYSVGDIYPNDSYYLNDSAHKMDGSVVFYIGHEHRIRKSFLYFDGQLAALDYMSLDEFISIFNE